MQCHACGTSNPAQARFCLHCGARLIDGQVCNACFTLLPPQARYCTYCGAFVGGPVRRPASTRSGELERAATVEGPPASRTPGDVSGAATQIQEEAAPSGAEPSGTAPQSTTERTAPKVRPITSRTQLPPPHPLQEMLPSLARYLPATLHEPLERKPTERNLREARNHLADLLITSQTYLPYPVVQAPQPAGEPRGSMYRGTFLFVDVSGFTPLSELLSKFGKAGAERITEIINGLFHRLVTVLFDHGGVLLKFGGDALLGLFAAESDDEMIDAALRAIQAAHAMQAEMEAFRAIEVAGQTRALRIKCGLSSGSYFAAHIGTPRSMAYVTTGHTVNRADQAEGHAEPGDVVAAASTLALLNQGAKSGVTVEKAGEGFHRVLSVPPLESPLPRLSVAALPEGETQAQITYLVEKMDRLAPYLAAELLPRLVTNPQEVSITPGHRPVTVTFANYVGVSDLIDDLGNKRPDLITHHLNDYFVHMAKVVEHYEGTLARMDQYSVGDRLVIFFGAPRVHEDDPVRAIYTALAMQETTRKHFAALQTSEGIYRFRQRVGINTGYLFAGNVGAPQLRQEYTLMGDAINMAARLMSKADWQQILVSRNTQHHVAPFFEMRDRGELKVKGKEILIPTFEVVGRRQEIGRTRGLDTGESPLIGREEALETLTRQLQALLDGRGQIISVMGDSGLGKSRLIRELRQRLPQGEELLWLSGQALSFSEQTAYWLVAQIVLGALELSPDATDDDVLYVLWERGEALLGRETAREAIPFLAHLLDLELEGEWADWVVDLDAQVRQKQTFWAARAFFGALARERPIVLALDDLHWADEASLSLLEDLLNVTDQAPLMFCLAFRARRDKGCWRLRDRAAAAFPHRYTEITLKPLEKSESQELLRALLPGAKFQPSTETEILDKTAGNPFYLEEVVRSLIESEAVVPVTTHEEDLDAIASFARALTGDKTAPATAPKRWEVTSMIEEIDVPDTLQAAILARIDRLTEDTRQALQMASVIGRRFEMDLLRNLSEAHEEINLWVAQLERNDLVRPAGTDGPYTYTFPDALVQEVAYESLLVQRRQQFHRRIGETLEALYGEQPEGKSELLAYHFGRSDDEEKAIHYLELAADEARNKFANETAITHYTAVLERIDDTEDWEKAFDLLARRQEIYGLVGRQQERQADLERMLALAKAHDDAGRRSDALNALAELYQWTGRYTEAKETAQAALRLKQELEDEAGEAKALNLLGVLHYYRGDYEDARKPLEQAVALRHKVGDQAGETWSLMYLYMMHFMRGEYDQAVEYNQHALDLSRERQDWFQTGIHLTNAARISLRLGRYEEAAAQFQESLTLKHRVGDQVGQGFALYGLGLTQTYLGHYSEAEEKLQASLELRQRIDNERGVGYSFHGLGRLALARDEINDRETARRYFTRAYDVDSRLELKAETVADLSFLAIAHLKLGEEEQALATSQQALELLAEQGDVPEVQQIYWNHYQVLKALGHSDADEYLHQAHAAVMEQAERIGDEELRHTFLESVEVNREIIRMKGEE
ncbi:MAG: adenylate/guanylate cyclase domain-containing protein [Anaerolineae bacterium]